MNTARLDRLTPDQRAELERRLAGRRTAPPRERQEAPVDLTASHPLSDTQYRLWLAEQAHGPSAAFTVPVALRVEGALDTGRLQACLDLLAERHLALRARIVQEGGAPRQRFDLPARIPLERRDLADGEAGLAAALREEAARVFSLARPPHVRAVLLSTGPQARVLVLSLHHAFCDGWSLEVLLRELFEAYGAPGAPALPAGPAAQHLDYARWEHSAPGRDVLGRNAAYWAGHHEDLTDRPELPFADGPGALGDPVSAFVPPAGLRERVAELARRAGATTHAVWLAAFAATWHLVTGVRAVPVGVPAANRGEARWDGAVGAFVTTLPLVVRVDPARTFTELVRRVTEALLEGSEHAAAPLGGPTPASPAAVFVFTGEGGRREVPGGLVVETLPVRVQGSQNELTVQLVERPDGPSGALTAAPGRYGDADLDRLGGTYLRCLDALLADPDAPLAAADLLDDRDRALLAASAEAAAAPAFGLPYQAFRHWVERTPDAFAAADADRSRLGYRELADRVEGFAAALHGAGVRPGGAVALCLPRSVDYLALTLAVWHLGGWTVPLNVKDPLDRLRSLVAGAGAAFLVRPAAAAAAGLPGVAELAVEELAGDGRAAPPPAALRPADLAYAVFTSGTTGTPKCVAVPQGALANELAWRRAAIGLDGRDRVLQTIPLAFDPAFWQCFGPLAAGAGVVLPEADPDATPGAVVDAAIAYGATVVDLVPSLLAALEDEDLGRLPARVVFCGGEPLPAAQAERYRRLGSGTLYNQYGPSETCIDASSHRYDGGTAEGTVSIGRPIGGVRLHVLDSALRRVPVGVTGELYIGGLGVARGYAGRPAETAARFLPEPAGPPGARMYRTGDRARWNPDGTVQFLGRADNQVKIRGHRVELEEVDRALLAVPGVREAAAVVVGERFHRLVGFLAGGPDLTPETARDRLARALPGYMVPAELRVLPALPTTANGKADRRRLTELAGSRPVGGPSAARRDDPVLAAVLAAFAAVLELPSASPEDDLYDLGGASLGAAGIAAELTTRLGAEVPVRLVLGNPRAADLAAALAAGTAGAAPAGAPADDLVPGPEQRQVLALERLLGRPAPPVPVVLDLEAGTGAERVADAVRRLAERHDALRPLPGASAPDDWQPCVTAALPAGPELLGWPAELIERHLSDGHPGLQAVLLRGGAGADRLLLLLARNRADGPSAGVLAEELTRLLAGREPAGPAPSYRRHLGERARRRALGGEELERYWTTTLEPLPLDPFAQLRTTGRGFRNHGVRWTLPAELDARLRARCAALGVAPAAPFLAALGGLVSRIAGAGRVVVGTPVGHRSGTAEAGLVGRAVDMLPVVLDAEGDLTAAHRALLTALGHADLPLERIAGLVDPVDPALRPAVCAAALLTHDYQGVPEGSPGSAPADEVPEHWSDLDLVLHVQPGPDGSRSLLLSGDLLIFDPAALRGWTAELAESLGRWAV
ncbi:non-ribosomal peptide synthetase [Kitasatospora albolonga]|uniref:non-ribosomal peptide synthetase n=1 Tax=Kitasatospora albolonga TaxID=68173 RepID=UPI0035E9735A